MNATSNRYQVSIEADPTVPIVRMTRDFDATPAQLMRAHTDPELFARWVGPNSLETKILDWDAVTGGRWRYVARRDGEEYGFHGCFHEVGEDRIVQTFTFDGQPDGVALETLWFEDLGDGRTRLHAQSLVDSFEGRDQWLADGVERGHRGGLSRAARQDVFELGVIGVRLHELAQPRLERWVVEVGRREVALAEVARGRCSQGGKSGGVVGRIGEADGDRSPR